MERSNNRPAPMNTHRVHDMLRAHPPLGYLPAAESRKITKVISSLEKTRRQRPGMGRWQAGRP